MSNIILYSVLYGFAVYFSNYIYGKALLILVVSIILFGKLSQKRRLLCLLVLSLSIYNPYFIAGIYPFLPAQHLKQKKILINILFLRFILENAYFLGCSTLFPLYYLWGIPIIILSMVMVRWKYTVNILFLLSLMVLTFQYIFNYATSKKIAYTVSSNNGIVANYNMLRDYFPRINNISVEELQKGKQNGFFIFPIAENKDLIKENYIKSNNIYLLLAEHDNLNSFLNKYPYFNNDGYQISIPWNLFKPNFVLPLKYITDKDIFYSSNIGCSVKLGYPIIWEYTWYGKPIILSSLANINKSKVFLWGDSDFFVNKLIPYNELLVEGFLGRIFYIYYIFAVIYVVMLYYLQKSNKLNKLLAFAFIAIITYLFPLQPQTNTKISIYSEIPYLTAHNEAHTSSILNILGRKNIAVQVKDKDANILILKDNNNINEFKNAQIIYLLSGASLFLNGDLLQCTNIKIGKESNTNVVDARFLIMNNKLLTTSLYQNNEYTIICTGSPQLNTALIMRKIINDK